MAKKLPLRTAARPRPRDIPRPPGPVEPSEDAMITDTRSLFVPSPGKDGMTMATRVDPQTRKQVQKIIQSGRTIFDTDSDLIRAAVVWFLQDEGIARAMERDLFEDDVQEFKAHVAALQRDAIKHDVTTYRKVMRAAINNFLDLRLVEDAVARYRSSLEVARKYHSFVFYEAIRRWAENEPDFASVHRIITMEDVNIEEES